MPRNKTPRLINIELNVPNGWYGTVPIMDLDMLIVRCIDFFLKSSIVYCLEPVPISSRQMNGFIALEDVETKNAESVSLCKTPREIPTGS